MMVNLSAFTNEHHVWFLEVSDADVIGGHDAEEGEEHDGEEGGDGEGDTLSHPVHSHQKDQEGALNTISTFEVSGVESWFMKIYSL